MPLNRPRTKKRMAGHGYKAVPRAVWRDLKPRLQVCAVPALALALYVVLGWLRIFSPIYPLMHGLALVFFSLWVVSAARSARGYWARSTHRRFAFLCGIAVILGSAWGPWASKDVRVWVTPPDYAKLPIVQMETTAWGKQGAEVLAGSVVHVGAITGQKLSVQLDADREELKSSADPQAAVSFEIPSGSKSETLSLIVHRLWRRYGDWRLHVVADKEPVIVWVDAPQVTARKTLKLSYEARDDYGVENVYVHVVPRGTDVGASGGPVDIDLARPAAKEVHSNEYADLTALPWVGREVSIQLVAVDGAGHKAWTVPQQITLPVRKFKNPLARALIEERERLLKKADLTTRSEAANVMAGMARQQALFRGDEAVTLALRAGAVRLVLDSNGEAIPPITALLWQTALRLEEGAMGRARNWLERLERDLAFVLSHGAEPTSLGAMASSLGHALAAYFQALEAERERSAAAVQEMIWMPMQGREPLQPEDVSSLVDNVARALGAGDAVGAQRHLRTFQTVIESLRTTPPELSPQQESLAGQIAGLRSLERGQRRALTEAESVQLLPASTAKERRARRERLAYAISRQKLLLAALKDWIDAAPLLRAQEAQPIEEAMMGAIAALKAEDFATAATKQAETLALLGNKILALSEKMRLSLTIDRPQDGI